MLPAQITCYILPYLTENRYFQWNNRLHTLQNVLLSQIKNSGSFYFYSLSMS